MLRLCLMSCIFIWKVCLFDIQHVVAQDKSVRDYVERYRSLVELPKKVDIVDSSETTNNLSASARSIRNAVFLVGNPNIGHGTAFLISKAHRLIATNAHVADMFAESQTMFAVANGTSDVYEVEQVWFHPRTARQNTDGVVTYSQSPGGGELYLTGTADVAVMRLKDGIPLPDEVQFASREEIVDLFGTVVAMTGFPGYDTEAGEIGHSVAQVTMRTGNISHLVDLFGRKSADWRNTQLIQHTMANFGGFSGSPIFTEDGKVVGINNMYMTADDRGSTQSISYGIRVDCLWELMHYHWLNEQNKDGGFPIDYPNLDEDAYERSIAISEEPFDSEITEAFQLAREAQGKPFDEAIPMFNESVELVENFSYALHWRGHAYQSAGDDAESEEEQIDYYKRGIEDFLSAGDANHTDYWSHICMCRAALRLANVLDDEEGRTAVRNLLDEIVLPSELSREQRADAYGIRASTYTSAVEELQDLTNAIEARPTVDRLRRRAEITSDSDQATSDTEQAKTLEIAEKLREQAEEKMKSDENEQALVLAVEANELTVSSDSSFLFTLAFAHLACGNYDEAMESVDLAKDCMNYPEDEWKVRDLLFRCKNEKGRQAVIARYLNSSSEAAH